MILILLNYSKVLKYIFTILIDCNKLETKTLMPVKLNIETTIKSNAPTMYALVPCKVTYS